MELGVHISDAVILLEALLDLFEGPELICERSSEMEVNTRNLTPYQKAQRVRRQTIAAHTPRPAKQSIFYKHAVRAIYNKLRRGGEGFRGAVVGGQRIAQWMLKNNGYATGDKRTGNFSLTSKGMKRNVKHAKEPAGIRTRKERAYDYIMGIQRRVQARKQQVKQKAASAG